MTEAIAASGSSMSRVEELTEPSTEPLMCVAPEEPNQSEAPSESPPAVRRLVEAHAGASRREAPPPEPSCAKEETQLALSGLKLGRDLATAVLTAPSEVALPLTIANLLLDAVAYKLASDQLERCETPDRD